MHSELYGKGGPVIKGKFVGTPGIGFVVVLLVPPYNDPQPQP